MAPVSRDARIRSIFGKQRRFTRARAAAALGRSERWVEQMRFSRENGGHLSWLEMVLLAYSLWTRVQIDRALGEQAATVFPALEQLVPLTVRIPAYKVIALRHEARRRKLDVSELVADDVTVFRDEAEELEETYPGYLDAWHFPSTRERAAQLRAKLAAERGSGQ
jgi:hypothetical protein